MTSTTEIGAAIERLGAARERGDLTRDDAVQQLRAIDPTLTLRGAEAQILAWRGAVTRYTIAAADRGIRLTGPGDARAINARPPIVFRFPQKEATS